MKNQTDCLTVLIYKLTAIAIFTANLIQIFVFLYCWKSICHRTGVNGNKIKKSPKTAKTYLVEVVLSEKKNRSAEVLQFIYFRQFKLTLGAGGYSQS